MRALCFTIGLVCLALAGGCRAEPASQEPWRIVDWSPDILIAVDEGSLQRTADGVRVTGATVFGEPVPIRDRSMTHLRSILDFTCPVGRARETYAWHFDRDGQFQEGDTGVDWVTIEPGTLYEAIATAACRDDLASLGGQAVADFDAVVALGARTLRR